VSLASSTCTLPASETSTADSTSSRLSRWFSIRRGNHYDLDRLQASATAKMPQLPEEEEAGAAFAFQHRRMQPPTLPPPPSGLTGEQVKRRHIVAAIVHSENSYMATLQRLVHVSSRFFYKTKLISFGLLQFKKSKYYTDLF
jgi:hypothetical protein